MQNKIEDPDHPGEYQCELSVDCLSASETAREKKCLD
jgi:hypothetical protein